MHGDSEQPHQNALDLVDFGSAGQFFIHKKTGRAVVPHLLAFRASLVFLFC
jgi:hypothetical protein